MRVRIEREVAKKVAAARRKTKRSAAAEVSMTLAAYYERQAIKEFLAGKIEDQISRPLPVSAKTLGLHP